VRFVVVMVWLWCGVARWCVVWCGLPESSEGKKNKIAKLVRKRRGNAVVDECLLSMGIFLFFSSFFLVLFSREITTTETNFAQTEEAAERERLGKGGRVEEMGERGKEGGRDQTAV
jgi:hypothetical protein